MIHSFLFLFPLGCFKKQQNFSLYAFPQEKKLPRISQKAYEKVFPQLSLADLSSIYFLIIFLKRIFGHVTAPPKNHQEFFTACQVKPKTSLKQSVPVAVCNFLLQVPCTIFLYSSSSLNKTCNLPFLNKLKISNLQTFSFCLIAMQFYVSKFHSSKSKCVK